MDTQLRMIIDMIESRVIRSDYYGAYKVSKLLTEQLKTMHDAKKQIQQKEGVPPEGEPVPQTETKGQKHK